MTVAELIERLKTAPQDALVVHMAMDESYQPMEEDDIEIDYMHLFQGEYRDHYDGCKLCKVELPLIRVVKL